MDKWALPDGWNRRRRGTAAGRNERVRRHSPPYFASANCLKSEPRISPAAFRMFARSTQFISTRTRAIRLARSRRFWSYPRLLENVASHGRSCTRLPLPCEAVNLTSRSKSAGLNESRRASDDNQSPTSSTVSARCCRPLRRRRTAGIRPKGEFPLSAIERYRSPAVSRRTSTAGLSSLNPT